MARPLLKLKHSVLLVMYSWLNGFYRVMNGKYSVTLLDAFLTMAPPINNIDSKCHIKKLGTYLIGYSDFISREWLFIYSLGADTYTNTQHTY